MGEPEEASGEKNKGEHTTDATHDETTEIRRALAIFGVFVASYLLFPQTRVARARLAVTATAETAAARSEHAAAVLATLAAASDTRADASARVAVIGRVEIA